MIKFPFSIGVLHSVFVLSTATTWGQAPLKVTPIPSGTGPAPAVVTPPGAPPVPQAPAIPVAVPSGPAKYVVKAGDNPWSIAKNHGIKLEDLLKANQIKDPKNLNIGDVLVLPVGVTSKGEPSSTAVPSTPNPPTIAVPVAGDNWEIYTIKKGDNPWNIAKRLKVDHRKILTLNEGLDFQKLKIGQQIKVPKKS